MDIPLTELSEGVWTIGEGVVSEAEGAPRKWEYRVQMQFDVDRWRVRRIWPAPLGRWSKWQRVIRGESPNI